LTEADSDDALPYYVAAGKVDHAVQHLTNRGHLWDAVLVAAAADEGSIPALSEKQRQSVFRKCQTENSEQQTRFYSCLFCQLSVCQTVRDVQSDSSVL